MLRIFLFFLLLACASERPPVFSEKQKQKNPYATFFGTRSPDLQRQMLESPYQLFLASNLPMQERLSQKAKTLGLLLEFPVTLIHGNLEFRALEKNDAGEWTLAHFEQSDWGPFWYDLLRAETGGKIVAAEQSLKLYRGGTCTPAYLGALQIGSSKEPSLIASEEAQKSITDTSAWQKGVAVLPDADWPKEFVDRAKEIRRTRSDIDNPEKEKYLLLTKDNILLEFSEVEAHPLAPLANLPLKKMGVFNSGCERFKKIDELFREARPATACVKLHEKDFVVRARPQNSWAIHETDFKNEGELEIDLRALCARIAGLHQKNWNADEKKLVLAALQKNPLYAFRIEKLAEEEAGAIMEAYRIALEARP